MALQDYKIKITMAGEKCAVTVTFDFLGDILNLCFASVSRVVNFTENIV